MKTPWRITAEDMDDEWVELPRSVYDRAMEENFWKAFWFGFGFACFLLVVFIIGVLVS